MNVVDTEEANPYLSALNTLNAAYYQDTSAGFKERLIVLCALNGLGIILGFAYLGLLVLDIRRKGTSGAIWLFRMVQRPAGRYIATNRNLWSALLGIVSGAAIIGHLYSAYLVYFLHTGEREAIAWRSTAWVPLAIHSWVISWAVFQSFILTPTSTGASISPFVANTGFVGLGGLLLVGLITVTAYVTITGNALGDKFFDLSDALTLGAAKWTGGDIPFAEELGFLTLLAHIQKAIDPYHYGIIAYNGFIATLVILVAGVNLGSIGLARILRKQIKYNLGQFRRPSLLLNGSAETETTAVSSILNADWDKRRLSRGDIRAISRSKAVQLGIESEQARGIMVLQRAEFDLFLISAFLFVTMLLGAGLVLWIAIVLGSGQLYLGGWAATEIGTFGIEWIYSIAVDVTLSLLIYNSLTHLEHPEPHDSTTSAGGATGVPIVALPMSDYVFGKQAETV